MIRHRPGPRPNVCGVLGLLRAMGLILGAPASVWGQVTVTLAPFVSPSVVQAGLVDASLIASNVPAGVANPSLINVTLQPAVGLTGPSATTPASEVVTITGSTR